MILAEAGEKPGRPRIGGRLAVLLASELAGALGVEFFNLTVVWHLVKLLGANSAYYLVIMLVCAVVSGVFGAGLFERVRPFRCTAGLNAVRWLAAGLALACIIGHWMLPLLLLASLCMSASRPHLDAALIGGLSTLGLDDAAMQRANALVDNTARLSRIAGPGVAALMAWTGGETLALMLTLGCFAGAALLQWHLDRQTGPVSRPAATERVSYWSGLFSGFRLAGRSPALVYCFVSQMFNAGAWYLGFVFSAALVLSSAPASGPSLGGLGGFAVATLCYGLGNIAGNIMTSRASIRRPMHLVVAGRAVAAVGYFLLATAGGALPAICLFAAVIALGTPPADLAFLKMLQSGHDWHAVTKLYRVKLVAEYAGMLLMMGSAPWLLSLMPPAGVITCCGGVMAVVALIGYLLLKKKVFVSPAYLNPSAPSLS